MIKKLLIAIVLAIFALTIQATFPQSVLAGDIRTAKVARFLAKYNSPLVFSAPAFVAASDKYGYDYRLLVAISGVESTFGKFYIKPTFNVWGWGVGTIPFTSFDDGIEKISFDLKTKYIEKGANEISEIARIYCPPTSASWAGKVSHFMNEIDQTDVSDLLVFNSNKAVSLSLTL